MKSKAVLVKIKNWSDLENLIAQKDEQILRALIDGQFVIKKLSEVTSNTGGGTLLNLLDNKNFRKFSLINFSKIYHQIDCLKVAQKVFKITKDQNILEFENAIQRFLNLLDYELLNGFDSICKYTFKDEYQAKKDFVKEMEFLCKIN